MGSGTERQVYTDAHGRFTIASPALAAYTFASTGASSCVDAVSGSALAFPHSVVLPPLANATITAISLLTVPARSDSALVAKYGSMAEVVPEELWTDVYGMFGHAASDKVRGSLHGWVVPGTTALASAHAARFCMGCSASPLLDPTERTSLTCHHDAESAAIAASTEVPCLTRLV